MRKFLLTCGLFAMVIVSAHAQDRILTGRVTSADDGLPLPSLSVALKGTTTGSVTDADGNYRISIPATGGTLIFRFLGYTTQEIPVLNQTIINVIMQPDAIDLETVVVTGYNEYDPTKYAGSAVQLKSDKIENIPLASFDQMLQGQASGLLVQSGSGQPGSAAAVTIRGVNSISSGTTPLYVVDGVPVAATQFASMNPNDFETVSVLKDASATSLYGSRGANGVIVITTKKGKAGKTQFTYNYQLGYTQELTRDDFLPVMNGRQKVDFELLNGGSTIASLTETELEALRNIDTDWANILFRSAKLESHEITASGGNENTTYYVSANVFSQEGQVITTGLDRYSLRANILNQSGDFDFGLNLGLTYSNQTFTREGDAFIGSPLNAIYWANPYETPYDADGNYSVIRTGQPNPLQEILENTREREDVRLVANVDLGYQLPVDGLSIRTKWGVDFRDRQTQTFIDPLTNPGLQSTGGQGSLTNTNERRASFVGTTSLHYERNWGDDHKLNVGLYQEMVYSQTTNFNYTGFGIVGRLENEASITAGTNANGFIPTVGGGNIENTIASFFALADYGLKNKYFFTASVRRDGSSRFGPNNRFATFWSVGGSWLLSNESFLDLPFLNTLKLRSSFGTTGNQAIGDFGFIAQVNTFTGNPYDGLPGKTLANVPNPDLKWETKQSFNVGLDFETANRRISGAIDFYIDDTKDLLMQQQLSRTTGFNSQIRNVGQIRNSGIELSLNGTVLQASNFTWNASANVTFNDNEVVRLVDGEDITTATTILREGEPINSNYVVPYVGVDPATGDALYRDLNGNVTNVYTPNDRRVFKPRNAPWFGGFTNNFSYKNVTLSLFFNWVAGNEVYNNERVNIENPTFFVDGMAASLLNAWQTPGQVTDVPRIRTVNGLTTNPFQSNTSRYLEDGSYLRLRNVQLSYNVPADFLSKLSFSSARIYVQGQNLLTFTNFSGADPEVNNGLFLGAVYPALRTYTIGLNIGF